MSALNGVSASICLARLVEGCLSSGYSSAACLAILLSTCGEQKGECLSVSSVDGNGRVDECG